MTEFNEGWWNCFCSFANELANVSSSGLYATSWTVPV